MINEGGRDAAQILRGLDDADRQELIGRNTKLIQAVEWAHYHPAESIDPHQLAIPGGDRPIHPGGAGTPAMAEFAIPEFATHLRKSITAGRYFIADALDLRYRLPRLLARVRTFEIEGADAQLIAQATRHLSVEQAGLVDAAVADYVGRLGRAALMRLVEAKIIEVDADRIAAEAERRQREKGVWVGQATEHGCKTVFARADACDVIWFDAMVDRFADLLGRRGDDRTKDERRAAAIGILANPAYALRLLAEDDAPSLFDSALGDEDLPEDDHDPAGEHPAQPEGPELVEGPETQPGHDHPVRYPRFDHDHNLARAAIRAISQPTPRSCGPTPPSTCTSPTKPCNTDSAWSGSRTSGRSCPAWSPTGCTAARSPSNR
ncbi:DUF222 domain-containing protein [Microlunatus elymi]|uniref:DUF222 domain-containing protein n=1 Tax=Microlunatus elymi TaxID=2596828 RepID=A0A516Q3U9_9ACTN|nr:DUF222 domain-containing protein [Microlunatus elymi]QDP98085.1 DUF222 domain-containing protein [Microlunatus elymi]